MRRRADGPARDRAHRAGVRRGARASVAFHHGLTVHMAKPNTTDHDRSVHTIIYFADGCTRRNDAWHLSVDRDGIEVGAPIAGPCTPIVWPRPRATSPLPRRRSPETIRAIAGAGTLPGRD